MSNPVKIFSSLVEVMIRDAVASLLRERERHKTYTTLIDLGIAPDLAKGATENALTSSLIEKNVSDQMAEMTQEQMSKMVHDEMNKRGIKIG